MNRLSLGITTILDCHHFIVSRVVVRQHCTNGVLLLPSYLRNFLVRTPYDNRVSGIGGGGGYRYLTKRTTPHGKGHHRKSEKVNKSKKTVTSTVLNKNVESDTSSSSINHQPPPVEVLSVDRHDLYPR